MAPSHLTLNDLKRSKSRSHRFQIGKGAQVDPMLQLNINRKPYMLSNGTSRSDLE